MLSVNEINLLQAQNEGLKKQNAELQKENTILKEGNYDKLIAWEEMQAENERLKEEIKEVKKYQYQQEFLEKEIEEQREKNKRLTCKILEVKALNETLNVQCTSQDCTQLRKLYQTLQEIKKILLQAMDVKSNAYNHFLKVEQAIDLITKAEIEEEEE